MRGSTDWLSITAYARIYGVHRNTVQKWLSSHLLVCYRVGRVIRIKDQPPLEKPTKPTSTQSIAASAHHNT